jgi:hypothetical protein
MAVRSALHACRALLPAAEENYPPALTITFCPTGYRLSLVPANICIANVQPAALCVVYSFSKIKIQANTSNQCSFYNIINVLSRYLSQMTGFNIAILHVTSWN